MPNAIEETFDRMCEQKPLRGYDWCRLRAMESIVKTVAILVDDRVIRRAISDSPTLVAELLKAKELLKEADPLKPQAIPC